jgi:hypothetical protein
MPETQVKRGCILASLGVHAGVATRRHCLLVEGRTTEEMPPPLASEGPQRPWRSSALTAPATSSCVKDRPACDLGPGTGSGRDSQDADAASICQGRTVLIYSHP